MTAPLLIAKNAETELLLLPKMANRHGLIAGATGTGKTVTLQRVAECLSRIGVPVFMADIKGDISGISQPGKDNPKVAERIKTLNLTDFQFAGCPVVFWDVFGEQGHPVRTTVSDMGPLLLSRLLNLNDTQSGVLTLVFKVADDHGLLLLDLKDLRAMCQHVGDNAAEYKTAYGNISAASIGAIQRGLLALEQEHGDKFFGEPALDIDDLIQTDSKGRGIINVLAADKLVQSPKVYATFLLWLMAELFERLPEAGDLDKPKLVFFFDEAHLLFEDAPKALVDKIEQVVRLVRSKAVGVYFITQNPMDVPEDVLGQLGNRVQHALRAFTPKDQKAVRSAAQTFRPNPKLDTETVITELGVGEALVSLLDEKGTPGIVERALVVPPGSQIGAITPEQRAQILNASAIAGVYEKVVDRESAYELLKGRAEKQSAEAEAAAAAAEQARADQEAARQAAADEREQARAEREAAKQAAAAEREKARIQREADKQAAADAKEQARIDREAARQQAAEARAAAAAARAKAAADAAKARQSQQTINTVVRAAGSPLGREIVRGIFGSLLGGSSKR